MSLGGGYTVLRDWSQVTAADSAPSASDTFVNPEGHVPGDDSIEIAFSEVTKDASTSATVDLWLRTYDSEGTHQVIPYSTTVAEFSASSTSDVTGRVQFDNVPAGSWYAQLASFANGSFTATAFIRSFNSVDE